MPQGFEAWGSQELLDGVMALLESPFFDEAKALVAPVMAQQPLFLLLLLLAAGELTYMRRFLLEQLLPLLDRLGLICGVSSAFSNLYEANQAWFQASSALQNGLLQDGSSTVFYFQDYLLPQLLSGALSGRPSWVYYPNGLKKLKAHDEASQVSYLETLRVYLDNNLSVTKTAAALYLHRSTLLDRLAHITQLLGCDLKNPDFCLTLGILLRAELQQKRIAQPRT